ncbi:cellulase family glycosylhydrolase [Lewinella sp. JB7]|uniref:cellulase family glycosylhydrolase n=1 Tax=Lewinella sp. JB7 TaxID=2962887 RepID=UPI0020CA040A|nr:cellulase family glycosylhydrolase [Lewinella sp. JB7]MCP9235697.1 cellulase family glycosylhydrolase [Lewinella sp. JB7]
MEKSVSHFVFTLLLLLTFSTTAHTQGFLHADGTRIVNGDGEEIIFRGIGLGGWMLQEGYMLGTRGPQYELEARIEELVGKARKEEFYAAWLANHTRKIDIDSMATWGFNLVRLPMHYKLFTPPIEEEPVPGEITWLDEGFEITDQLLEWCKDNDIYLILDLHAAPGGQGENADISDYDPTKPSLWESQANRTKMIALWRKLAERYADEPMIAAYDIINEPNWGFENHDADPNGCAESQNSVLWQLQQEVTAAIREVDQKHLIVIEGNCWGNNYRGLPDLWDDNLVVSYHKYWNPNDQDAIQHMLQMREDRQVPIWLGETGENSNTWFTNAIALFERNGFGWSWWPLKKLGYNNPLQVNRNPAYRAILDYWKSEGPQPSPDTAFAGLMQLAEDLKLENNQFHPSVVDAMIRQPHSEDAIPFKAHVITAGTTTIIYPTDFDMGPHGMAYSDMEVENTTGKPGGQRWNLGSAYRNDGVDIEASEDDMSNGYHVGWTEAGEWLQYTVRVEEAGRYDLTVRTASVDTQGKLQIMANGTPVSPVVSLPDTGGKQQWEATIIEDVPLSAGTNVIRLNIVAGGFNLSYLAFSGPQEDGGE